MKKISIIIIVIAFLIGANSFAQNDVYPVKWKTSVKKISENEYELTAIADIDESWNLYGNEADDPAVPTTFYFDTNGAYEKAGKIKESEGGTYDGEVKIYSNKAAFTQKIKVKTNVENIKITGTVEYMVCSNTTCLPPTESTLAFDIQKVDKNYFK